MKRHQYLSANAATFLLAFLLWQTQVNAEVGRGQREESETKRASERDEEVAPGVTKGQQRKRRMRSAMRQRALIYESAIAAAAAKYRVDPRALWTIAYLETRFRPWQQSPKGARGLMQFMPGTAARFNLKNAYDAIQSIDAAAQYVAVLSNQFNGRLDLVLASYNSGEAAVDCYLKGKTIRTRNGKLINPRGIKTSGVPPYAETQSYVRRGMLVFSRVASASVFSEALIASVRPLSLSTISATAIEVASINNELADLGGGPAVLYSDKTDARAAARKTTEVEQAFATVFFDVHSGARYLVQSGEIVKPLEPVTEETTAGVGDAHKEVTKSVYIGTRED
ncbi:MAG: hypothetical protein QOH70_2090 [Blastocatellia bacterium]|jgi:hypothetical protein|nr:hypothetical protein [Blastocatellia bacterium]